MARDYSRAEVLDIIEREAQERSIPRDDFMRFAYIETGGTFNELASRGERGAKGLFQFVPSTATHYGIRGNELDAIANTDAAARLYLDNQRSLVRRHAQDGRPYLSGKAQPDGLDMYMAHQQGAAGYRSIQTAIATGEFGRSDTRANILNNVSARDLRAVTGVSMDQFRTMSDQDLARTFVGYWDAKFDRVRIPEKAIEPVVEGRLTDRTAIQPQVPAKTATRSSNAPGIQLTAAHAMAVKYDDVGYKMGGKNVATGAIDCSGWVVALQNATMKEINTQAGAPRRVFGEKDFFRPAFDGSGTIVKLAAERSGVLLEGRQVNAAALKDGMVIGLDTGPAPHDKWKGIDHVAMVVRDPQSGALMVTESKGGKSDRGVRLLPVEEFLERSDNAKLYAADPLSKARGLLEDRQRTLEPKALNDGTPAYGERNADVKGLQGSLRTLGINADDGTPLRGTGYYGDRTKETVANFQRHNGLEPSGVADTATLEAIGRKLREGRVAAEGAEQRPLPARAPLISASAHPNHALFADVSRRITEQTGAAPKPEAAANVSLQMLENGFRGPQDIRGLAVRGSDVHVQGSAAGSRVSVDLNAPTPDLQAMSDHMLRQTQERVTRERDNRQSPVAGMPQ